MKTIRAALNELILASHFENDYLWEVFSYDKLTYEMIATSAAQFLGSEEIALVHELMRTDFLLQPESEIPPLVVGWSDSELSVPYRYEFYFRRAFERKSVVAFFVDLILKAKNPLIIDNMFEPNQVSHAQLSPHRVYEIVILENGEIQDCEKHYWQSE